MPLVRCPECGAYVIGGNRQDPEAVEFFKRFIGG